MPKEITKKITIWGIVQGVGFRPMVSKVAFDFQMKGQVANTGGLVEIIVTDTEDKIFSFIQKIKEKKPVPAEIVHIKVEKIEAMSFESFSIIDSSEGKREIVMIPADIAICEDCLRELRDKNDERYNHPFISCMACGPRYTIIKKVPYDRKNTTMKEFDMCRFCFSQYKDIKDRRFHAQTISCHDCGPVIKMYMVGEEKKTVHDLDMAVELLKEGNVIAFKSVGGYNLIADPLNEKAVKKLREIKNREAKPFAVMFKDIESIKDLCKVNSIEESLLISSARPIILLEKDMEKMANFSLEKEKSFSELDKSRFIGAFLPSMAAQYIILDLFEGPLIVTSANVSGNPMIKDEEEMFALAKREKLIKAVFYNEREIFNSADDSVVRVIDNQPQIIRRSKGYVPVPLYLSELSQEIIATGGQLKNSFCVGRDSFAYPSQYFGDMDTVDNQNKYEENLKYMLEMLRIIPEKIVCDLHPLYNTTIFAEKYSKEKNIPIIRVQHHHAHIASVMAEHNLKGKVIGVSMDGTGYGEDGAIWGGEILLCQGKEFQRLSHLKYTKMLGGDSLAKEGWKAAICFKYDAENKKNTDENEIEIYVDDIVEYAKKNNTLEYIEEKAIKKAIDMNINTIKSSSMGRLFDGVSAMLGICQYNNYEGQCAIMLEDAACRGQINYGNNKADDLAYDFHIRVADAILFQCIKAREKNNVNQVALTGGVFQNKILMEIALKKLREEGFQCYYNISVSPNDGGIALGQIYIAAQH